MKIIAGLGNPGSEYAATKHNVGFMLVDALADKLGIDAQTELYRVDGVNHIIERGKIQRAGLTGKKEEIVTDDPAFRIDALNPAAGRFGFPLPEVFRRREDLTVQIGRRDGIAVNQIQLPDSGTRQRFRRFPFPWSSAAGARTVKPFSW